MIIVQVISILFAVALAKHDAPAIDKFNERGIDNISMSVFHRYNAWLKLFFCIASAFAYCPNWKSAILAGLFSGLWIYLVFDIALNRSRHYKLKWHYLGLNDKDGRFWNNWFGDLSGKAKAIVLLAAIIAVNWYSIKHANLFF